MIPCYIEIIQFQAFWTISERSGLYELPHGYKSATDIFHKGPIQSHQMYEIPSLPASNSQDKLKTQRNYDPVGKPIKHKAADKQVNHLWNVNTHNCTKYHNVPFNIQQRQSNPHPILTNMQATGEAVYVDDIPYSEGELYAGLVLSEKAHANILEIDASQALQMEGVVDFVCHK